MLFIFDRDENLKAVLRRESPESMPYWEAAFVEQLNGDIRLKFHIPADHEDAQYIEEESRVVYRDDDGMERLLVVREAEEKRTSDDRVRKFVYCKDAAIPELNDAPVERVSFDSATPLLVLQEILKNSRYQIGIVDSFEPKPFHLEMTNAMYAINQMIDTWGGEIRFRVQVSGSKIAFRYVDFLTRRGRVTGKRFEYRKDIQEIIRKVNTKNLKTAIYPIGKSIRNDDGTEEPLTIEDVEWSVANGDPIDKPKGQKWIGDPNALERWGYLNADGTRSHRFGFYENNDIEDPEELIQAGWKYLQESGILEPEVSYELTVLTLERLSGYEHEAVRLGDTVYVIDRGFKKPIVIEARVIEIERDLDKPKNSRIVLGNFTRTILNTVEQVRNDVEKRVRPIERITFKNSILNLYNNIIEAAGGYVVIDNPNGIMIYDKPWDENPDKAMQMNSAGLRIAGRRDPNTQQFDWRTAITYEGIVADAITTGTLNASLVNIVSESADKTRTVRIGDGNIYSYEGDLLSMRLGSYRWDFYDRDGLLLGYFGTSFYTNDPQRRGMTWTGTKSFITISKQVGGILRSFFDADLDNNTLYLSGGWSGSQSNSARLTLYADEWVWGTGGPEYRSTNQPTIQLLRNAEGSSTVIYYSDSYSSGSNSFFEVRENSTETTYRTMIRCSDATVNLIPRVYFGSNRVGWVEGTSNSVRLGAGPGTDNYIYVLNNGNIFFRQNGVVTNSFYADGTKNTGVIELDGKLWGMSPIDSPQYLVEYILFDQEASEAGTVIQLDSKYIQTVDNYAVFPSRGDVSVVNKTPTSFVIKGSGKVDLRIVGIRKGHSDIFWTDVDARLNEGKKMMAMASETGHVEAPEEKSPIIIERKMRK